ncbi:hypothetical protein Taro_023943 [Colocasia esculenta]|uniref:Uncharacterized protein n=1 Tax=Colocasia esculenta TaxID=4460 RepID=A0A843VC98_COLES|nr:hypothetical protein [Colocasia esculenta]
MACASLFLLAGGPLTGHSGAPYSRLRVSARCVLSPGGHALCGKLPIVPLAFVAPSLPRPAQGAGAGRRRPPLARASAEDLHEEGHGGGAAAAPVVVSPESGEGTDEVFPGELIRSAGLVGAATVASKILGLLREVVIASVFGVGPVATAFNHAVVLPRFCSSFLGGVNGPIHIAVATTLRSFTIPIV